MDGLLLKKDSARRTIPRALDRIAGKKIEQRGRRVIGSRPTPIVAVDAVDKAFISAAQSARVFNKRIKHRLEVRRRAADHTQDFARRRLLLERDPQLVVARLQLLEEPHVLDGDDGLLGKG